MNLLLVTVHFAPAWIEGGVTRATWNAARALAMAGAQVRVVTTNAYLDDTNQVPALRDEAGLSIRTVRVLAGLGPAAHRSGLALGLPVALWQAGHDADLCLMQGLWTLPVAVASTICHWRNLPYVLWAQGGLEELSLSEKAGKKTLYRSLFLGRAIRRAGAVCFESETEHRNSRKALGDTTGIVYTPGFDPVERQGRGTARLRSRLGLPSAVTLLGICGRIHPRKGFDVILPALARCPEHVHLVSFGPDLEGYLPQVRELADQLGVTRRFHVLGYLQGEELQAAYAAIDLLVLPSYGESFGIVVTEALRQGTEVMLSDKVALAGYVEANRLGRVVTGHEPDRWSAAIGRWITESGDFDRERARRMALEDFSLESSGRQLLSSLQGLLAAGGGPAEPDQSR